MFVVHQIHKCILNVAPDYLISTNSSFDYSSTRGCDDLHLFRPKSDFGKNTLHFKGAQLYNSLSSHIRVLQNLSAFRRACVTYFSCLIVVICYLVVYYFMYLALYVCCCS